MGDPVELEGLTITRLPDGQMFTAPGVDPLTGISAPSTARASVNRRASTRRQRPAARTLDWNPITAPQDYIELAGQKSPGIAEVSISGAEFDWTVRRPRGLYGAVYIFYGMDPLKFEVRITLLDQRDWKDWHTHFRPLVWRPARSLARGKDLALGIKHPLLDEFDINACIVLGVELLDATDDGTWQWKIRFQEYRGLNIALQKPDAVKATPVDPVDLQIGEALTQFKIEQAGGEDALNGLRDPSKRKW
jgi:hypothetical protein